MAKLNNTSIQLEELLIPLKAYKKDRLNIGYQILENPGTFPLLLDYCFQTDDAISYKAAWILEIVCLEKINLLFPFMETFLKKLPKVYKDQAVRPLAKICEELLTTFYSQKQYSIKLVLKKKHREQLTEICFDWLITDQKVAAKAYAMQCLYLLGLEFQWIHPELKTILDKDFPNQQPAYKSRAKHILKKLNR